MKKLILCSLLLPFISTTTNTYEVRAGTWPITMEQDIDYRDTSYSLIFRNQENMIAVTLDTLVFGNLTQLHYFGQALNVLKNGKNGDIAKFKDYFVKRTVTRYQPVSYLLETKYSSTQFAQPEADLMSKTIKGF